MASSFNLETCPAILVPFDFVNGLNQIASNGSPQQGISTSGSQTLGGVSDLANSTTTQLTANQIATIQANAMATRQVNQVLTGVFPLFGQSVLPNIITAGINSVFGSSSPLYPILQTGGLVFPYSPIITESIGVKYDTTELTHVNESINAFKSADNIRITLSDCIWTAETFDQAVYMLAVIHFFRSFTKMDFGRGTSSTSRRPGSGKPPSLMWFSCYGNYMYYQVPVLLERVEISLPSDIDYVGVPNPGTSGFLNQELAVLAPGLASSISAFTQSGQYTWVPIKLTIGSITLVVQHSVTYWTENFSLTDFQNGVLTTVV